MVPLVPAGGKFDKRKGKSGRIEGVDNERERERIEVSGLCRATYRNEHLEFWNSSPFEIRPCPRFILVIRYRQLN